MNVITAPMIGMGSNHVLQFQRPFRCTSGCCYLQEMDIAYMQGGAPRPLGRIEQQCSVTGVVLNIVDGSGATLYTIMGPCCVWDTPCCSVEFEVRDPSGEQVVGKIHKMSGGAIAQMLTDADNFGIEFPQGAGVEAKAILLGCVSLIDMMFFESTGNSASNDF